MSKKGYIGCYHHYESNCCDLSDSYKSCPGAFRLGCTKRISFKCWTANKRCGEKECKCQCRECKSSVANASDTSVAKEIPKVRRTRSLQAKIYALILFIYFT